MKKICNLVDDFKILLIDKNLADIPYVLDKGWALKKELASRISNSAIDEVYSKALKLGSRGGKILGAGGGGFLLLHSQDHKRLSENLNLKSIPFQIDREGTKILFYE